MYPQLEQLKHTDSHLFFLMAGPCVIEGEEMAMRIAETIVKITDKWNIPYIFKGSYRKANRSRFDSFTGIGDEKALRILRKVHETFDVPVVTDIHTAEEAAMQPSMSMCCRFPPFCAGRPTCLWPLPAPGKRSTSRKASSFRPKPCSLPPVKLWSLVTVMSCLPSGVQPLAIRISLSTIGGIPQMQSFGFPVVLDVTHSLQQPNQTSGVTGGVPRLIETIGPRRHSRRG